MPIKVMIVDDSLFIRAILRQIIENDEKKRFKVVAAAINGEDALRKLKTEEIDVITLDVEMPKMNGLEALAEIMKFNPKPVIMVSSLTKKGAKETTEALQLGAVDFIQKPDQQIEFSKIKEAIHEKIETAMKVNRRNIIPASNKRTKAIEIDDQPIKTSTSLTNLIAIGTSTGGPRALHKILTQIPKNLKAGILIVQHMPAGGYTSSLAEHLNETCNFKVQEAKEGSEITDGVIYIAPGGYHMELLKRGNRYQTSINKKETISGHRPSVDALFYSIAKMCVEVPVIGVVLTGMGADGSKGIVELKSAGATIFAESEKTSVIYGMPKQAAKTGVVDYIEDLEEIIPKIEKLIK